jgi:hypothetical protein
MLWMFERVGGKNAQNERYQFWQNGYHPVKLCNARMVKQRLNYVHDNSTAGLSTASPVSFYFVVFDYNV